MSGPVGVGGFEKGEFEGDSPTEKVAVAASAYGGDEPDEVMEAKTLAPFAVPVPPYARKGARRPRIAVLVRLAHVAHRRPPQRRSAQLIVDPHGAQIPLPTDGPGSPCWSGWRMSRTAA
jgi:hypothetical protein